MKNYWTATNVRKYLKGRYTEDYNYSLETIKYKFPSQGSINIPNVGWNVSSTLELTIDV
jgi:hypothetical protein